MKKLISMGLLLLAVGCADSCSSSTPAKRPLTPEEGQAIRAAAVRKDQEEKSSAAARVFPQDKPTIMASVKRLESTVKQRTGPDASATLQHLDATLAPLLRSSIATSPDVAAIKKQVDQQRPAVASLVLADIEAKRKAEARQKAIAGALTLANQACQVRLATSRDLSITRLNLSGLERFDFCQAAAMKDCVRTYGQSACDAAAKIEK